MQSPENLLSYCGLICQGCPLFWATQETDPKKSRKIRIEVSRQCRELYDMDIDPENTGDCDGCKNTSGRIFSGCKDCFMRQCAIAKNIPTCAHCEYYPYSKLSDFFKSDLTCKSRLDVIRTSIL